jgi:hypothetical protein
MFKRHFFAKKGFFATYSLHINTCNSVTLDSKAAPIEQFFVQ